MKRTTSTTLCLFAFLLCLSMTLQVQAAPGDLDPSFGNGGKVFTSIGKRDLYGSAIAVQADGKIVTAGGSDNRFALTRHNADDSLDTTFDGDGILTAAIIGDANAIAIQSDGKIVVAGYDSTGGQAQFLLARFSADGSPDTTFDGDGQATTAFAGYPSAFVFDLAIQADGKIVAAGYAVLNNSSNSVFALARFNNDGTLDTGFSGDGKVTTNVRTGYANAVAIQSNGKIIAAGYGLISSDYDFALLRYQSNSKPVSDFDGDGKSDISVFRPSESTWYLNRSQAGFSATQFGLSTDKITPADYDGDGRTDISVYRDGTWYWLNSSNGNFNAMQFGLTDDIPVPADFTGDGRAELAVYRNGTWWTYNLANNQTQAIQFGLITDKPVPADYDGDGKVDQAVYRGNGEWHLNRSMQGYAVVQFGLATDKPVVGDYDGDGKTDLAVYRDGIWYLLQSSQGFTAFQFGVASDIPAPADYDGDGRVDAAVYRDGTWWILQSASGVAIQQFGLANDKPVPAAFSP